MRIFYEPTTAAIAVGAGVAALKVAQGVTSGIQAKNEADAARQTEQLQRDRDVRDEERKSRRQLARQRAQLAAAGVDLNDASLIFEETAGESQLRINRRRSDARRTDRSLRRQGRQALAQGILGGVSQGGQSLLAGGVV